MNNNNINYWWQVYNENSTAFIIYFFFPICHIVWKWLHLIACYLLCLPTAPLPTEYTNIHGANKCANVKHYLHELEQNSGETSESF